MQFLLRWSFHPSFWFSFLWYSSTSSITEKELLWKAALEVSGQPQGLGRSDWVFYQHVLTWHSHEDRETWLTQIPSGSFFLHFPQSQHCTTTQVSTSSPGFWEKLLKGGWLLFLGLCRLEDQKTKKLQKPHKQTQTTTKNQAKPNKKSKTKQT